MSELSERVYLMEYKQKIRDKDQEKRQKEIEKRERKKERKEEEKQYLKDLLLACKRELKERFEEDFELQGTNAKYTFYNIKTRNILIKSIAKSEMEADYLENNYSKILNEVIKKYELHEKHINKEVEETAKQYVEEMRPQWEEEAKKENVKKNILTFFRLLFIIIKWVLIILFGGVFLILKFIFGLAGI